MVAEKVRQRLLPGSSSQSSCGDDEEMDSKEETKDWLMSVRWYHISSNKRVCRCHGTTTVLSGQVCFVDSVFVSHG